MSPLKRARRPNSYTQRNRFPVHSDHSGQRCSERAISDPVCELIWTHGTYAPAECGRWRRQLDWYQLTKLARQGVNHNLLADAVGASLIVPNDETLLITVMWDNRPRMAPLYKSQRTSLLGTPSKIRKAA